MADNITLSTLRKKIRARGEVKESYVPNADLNDWINDSIKELYDHIITVNQDFFVTISSPVISVVSGTESYTLPSDFALGLRVEVLYQGVVGSGTPDWRPLQQFNLSERSDFNWYTPTRLFWRYRYMDDSLYLAPIPNESASIRIWYTPVPPVLDNDDDSTNFIFGWDEYVILDCLEKHAMKEESDPSAFMAKKQQMLERVLSRAKYRDAANNNTVRDAEREAFYARYPWIRVP